MVKFVYFVLLILVVKVLTAGSLKYSVLCNVDAYVWAMAYERLRE